MKTFFSKTVASGLIIALLVPILFAFVPAKKAEASATACLSAWISVYIQRAIESFKGVVNVPTHNTPQDGSDAEQAATSRSQQIKDCIEKPLAFVIARAILAQMTNDIVNWINGGFQGKPAFISNPGQFFMDMADQVIGEAILGTDLAFLCSPFKLQIQIALATSYSSGSLQDKARCTLSSIIGNIEGFYEDFNQGGWAGWLSMTQNNQNNPYGAYMESHAGIGATVNGQRNIEILKLNWGGGFLSWEECEDGSVRYGGNVSGSVAGSSFTTKSSQNCTIKTPGRTIGDMLNNQLGIPGDELGLADDLDKIFNALGNQLINQIITKGIAGLSRATGGGGGGSSNYLDQLVAESNSRRTQAEADRLSGENQLGSTASQTAQQSGGASGQAPITNRNYALNKVVTSSSAKGDRQALVNGNKSEAFGDEYTGFLTNQENNPWGEVNLEESLAIRRIILFQRNNPSDASRRYPALPIRVQIYDRARTLVWQSTSYTQDFGNPIEIEVPAGNGGRYIRIVGQGEGRLEFTEMEVYPDVPPKLTLKGGPVVTMRTTDTYSEQGYTATDDIDGDITSKVTVTGTVTSGTPGTYTLTYRVADDGGSVVEVTRQVIVQPNVSF